eukprot:1155750-Pelagomonas_calceolata.AAC.1
MVQRMVSCPVLCNLVINMQGECTVQVIVGACVRASSSSTTKGFFIAPAAAAAAVFAQDTPPHTLRMVWDRVGQAVRAAAGSRVLLLLADAAAAADAAPAVSSRCPKINKMIHRGTKNKRVPKPASLVARQEGEIPRPVKFSNLTAGAPGIIKPVQTHFLICFY